MMTEKLKLLAAAAAAGLAVLIPVSAPAWAEEDDAAVPLTICAAAPIASLDAARHVAEDAAALGPAQIFDTLVAIAPDGHTVEPALARWWDISKDGLEYLFKLRPAVRFQAAGEFEPTRDLDAEDVVLTFIRQIDPDHPVAPARPLAADLVGLTGVLERVEAAEDGQVRFVLKAPDAGFLGLLAMGFAGIQSREYAAYAVARAEPELLDTWPVGTGPFAFAGRHGDRLSLKAHAGHWGGAPAAAEIAIRPIASAARRFAAIRQGRCHVALSPEAADTGDLAADPAIRLERLPLSAVVYAAFNTTRAPLDDPWVRRALGEAVDRDKLVAAAPDGAVAAPRLTRPAPGSEAAAAPADPALAATHLKASGQGALAITLLAPGVGEGPPDRPDVAEVLAATWRALGVEVTVRRAGWAGYLASLRAGEHDAAIVAFAPETPDDAVTLQTLLTCAAVGTSNFSHWCDPAFDELLRTARTAADPVQRAQALEAARRVLDERAPALALFRPTARAAVRREVAGFDAAAFARGDLTALSLAPEPEPGEPLP